MNDGELLELHRALVRIPSPSHSEGAVCAFAERFLRDHELLVERLGDNVIASFGAGPLVLLNTHLDTVPASSAWTRPPHDAVVEEGRVYGLGANDAKAAAAAMMAACLRLAERHEPLGVRVMLTLVCEEETGGKGGKGTELVVKELERRAETPNAVIVGEPTGLDIAIAQKGLLVLSLRARGRTCHAAHAQTLGVKNTIRELAADLVAIGTVDLGPPDPWLGPTTVEPTVLAAGGARNMVPAEASCVLDVRTNSSPDPAMVVERLRAAIAGELVVESDRLRPCAIDEAHVLVRAARTARPEAKLIGSRTMSDLVFFAGLPGIKVGPGATERSHTPDEFVLESEILAGAQFYEALLLHYAAKRASSDAMARRTT